MYSEWTPDDGKRHCPKHVKFHAKNKICEISASTWSYYKEIWENININSSEIVHTVYKPASDVRLILLYRIEEQNYDCINL